MKAWMFPTTWTLMLLVAMATSEECTGVYTAYMVVDGSESISLDNFLMVKKALKIFINESITGNSAVRIGIVIYSDDVTDVIPAASNITTLADQIDDALYPDKGTATHLGIERAKELLQADPSPNPRVMIVITDGVSDDSIKTSQAASQAREAGITMIAVGIDEKLKQFPLTYEKYYSGLHDIASSSNNVFQIETFVKVATDVKQIVQTLCLSVVMITDGLSDVTAPVGSSPAIRVILSQANVTNGIWTKEGTDLTSDTRYVIATKGNTQTLKILNVTLRESGEYTYTIGNTGTSANLTVVGVTTATATATVTTKATATTFTLSATLKGQLSTSNTDSATTATTTSKVNRSTTLKASSSTVSTEAASKVSTFTVSTRITSKTTARNNGAVLPPTTDNGKDGLVPFEAIIASCVTLAVIVVVVSAIVALRWRHIRGFYNTKTKNKQLKRKKELK